MSLMNLFVLVLPSSQIREGTCVSSGNIHVHILCTYNVYIYMIVQA